jgi:CRP-like cAMP-binding protein/Zn-dependent protease
MPTELDFGPFLALPEEARAALAARARSVHAARSEHLLRAGDEPDAALVIRSGRVRVTDADGTLIATMTAPALVGELAVLDARRRSANVVALEPVRALRIDADELRSVVARQDGFARMLEAFAEARRAHAFLKRQGPFADLPSSELEQLAAKLRPARFAPGDVLVREGEHGDDVFLIRDGEVDAVRTEGGSERVLSHLGPGSLVGEIAVLTGSPRTATVRATTDVNALVIPGDDVRAVVKRHRSLLDRVTSVMRSRYAPRRTGEHWVEPAPDDPSSVILHDPARAVYLRLDEQALAIYRDLDGDRTVRDLALRHFERTGTLDAQAVFSTVAALQVAGFATAPRIAGDAPEGRVLRGLDLIVAPRIEVRDADGAATALHRFAWPLFTRPGAIAALALGIGGLASAIPLFRTASPSEFGPGGIVVAFLGLLLAGIGHEIAHALAAKSEGSRLGRAGIGLFWFTPVVYVDTSSTWAISRAGRIRVNAAGPIFNLALAGLFGAAAHAATGTAQDVLVWLSLTNVVLFVFNLSPLLEFDGYYVLSDLTNTNALRRKAMRFVFHDLWGAPRRPASRAEAGLVLYTIAALLYVLAMSTIAIAGVSHALDGSLPPSLGEIRGPLGIAAGMVLAIFLVFPFLSEALDARGSAAGEATGAWRVEHLDQRVSKSDLGAALGVKTGTVDIGPPSKGLRGT